MTGTVHTQAGRQAAGAPLGSIGLRPFLDEFWQRQPCLIRQAFPGFIPDLDENDIAGLACEELAQARLISGTFAARDWSLRYGPFQEDELRQLGPANWTLLVQDVEKHYPPLQSLLAQFRFLPSWRLDDLMVSVAAPGGSVGPHVDQYDVFLLQACGQRRWQISQNFSPALLPDCELNVLQNFTPEQEWLLHAGDMLYLPPGVAHHGIAVDLGMTWSIGLRAPSQADLVQAFGEWLAEHQTEGERYTDPPVVHAGRAGEIDRQVCQRMRKLAGQPFTSGPLFDQFLGEFLSRYRLAQQPAEPRRPVGLHAIDRALGTRSELQLNPWTRLAWLDAGAGAVLFAAGSRFECGLALATLLCASPPALPAADECSPQDRKVLLDLVNQGHLLLPAEPD